MTGNPISRSYNGLSPAFELGPQQPIALDYRQFEGATLAVWLSATGTYTLEFTLDDVNADGPGPMVNSLPNPNARWFAFKDAVALTAAGYIDIFHPVQFVRVNFAALGGSAEFKIVQSGTSRN